MILHYIIITSSLLSLCRLSEQAQRQLQDSDRFEDILMGASRPGLVMQRYQDLYTQGRVEAYDTIADTELVEQATIPEFLLDVLKVIGIKLHYWSV